MQYKALPRTLIVRRLDKNERTNGLIIIPTTRMFKETCCEVLSIGPEKVLKNGEKLYPDIQVGDKIHCLAYDGIELDPINNPGILQIDMEMAWGVVKRIPVDDKNGVEIYDSIWEPNTDDEAEIK